MSYKIDAVECQRNDALALTCNCSCLIRAQTHVNTHLLQMPWIFFKRYDPISKWCLSTAAGNFLFYMFAPLIFRYLNCISWKKHIIAMAHEYEYRTVYDVRLSQSVYANNIRSINSLFVAGVFNAPSESMFVRKSFATFCAIWLRLLTIAQVRINWIPLRFSFSCAAFSLASNIVWHSVASLHWRQNAVSFCSRTTHLWFDNVTTRWKQSFLRKKQGAEARWMHVFLFVCSLFCATYHRGTFKAFEHYAPQFTTQRKCFRIRLVFWIRLCPFDASPAHDKLDTQFINIYVYEQKLTAYPQMGALRWNPNDEAACAMMTAFQSSIGVETRDSRLRISCWIRKHTVHLCTWTFSISYTYQGCRDRGVRIPLEVC